MTPLSISHATNSACPMRSTSTSALSGGWAGHRASAASPRRLAPVEHASCLITLVTLQATSMPASVASGTLTCALPGLPVAQGDFVGLGDVVGLDGPQSQAQAFASLPQQLEGVGGGALRGGALRISPVFLDEVGLQGCGDFIGRLQRVVDGPVPCCVVNHVASIARQRASGGRGLTGRAPVAAS